MLAETHIGLDQDFDDLVDDHEYDAENDELPAFRILHRDYFLPLLASISLASTVRVA